MNRPTRQHARRGFTLIELGVALAVAAILAAAVLPDLVESSRNVQAERTALDISYIHDAARWYRSQTNGITDSSLGVARDTWPGQSSSGSATTCPPVDSSNAFQVIKSNGFLIEGQARNPWGKDYTLSSVMNPAPGRGCTFMVSTEVPSSVADTLTGMLPLSFCNDANCGPPATTPGFTRCCSAAVRPGMRVSTSCGGATPVVTFNSANGTFTCTN